MLQVLGCITQEHDLRLVALAAVLCAFACWTAISLASRARVSAGAQRTLWTLAAGGAFGAGVWATHFVAILAFALPYPIGYGLFRTALSIAVAIFVSTGGFAAILSGRAATGGAVLGLAVAGMHFVGMSALEGPFLLRWDWPYVFAAIGLGVGLSMAAAVAGTRIANSRGRQFAALLLVIAICALHFTAMTGEAMVFNPTIPYSVVVLDPKTLAIAVAAVTCLIVGMGLAGALLDRYIALRRSSEAERLRAHIVELEETKKTLEETSLELRVALAKADAANAAKSSFLAAMSHELRTPLNAIIGFSELMAAQMGDGGNTSRHLSYAKDIHRSGLHLLSLINDVLDLSRLDAGATELADELTSIEGILKNAVTMTAGQAQANSLTLALSIEDKLSEIQVDRRRMLQIVLNLISNAIKFTPAKGKVTVAARRANDGIAISVTDTGIGIAAADIPRALERFGQVDSRLSRKYEGSGLGLPLAKQLIELHGGTLTLDSEPGKGTMVTVTIPESRIVENQIAAA